MTNAELIGLDALQKKIEEYSKLLENSNEIIDELKKMCTEDCFKGILILKNEEIFESVKLMIDERILNEAENIAKSFIPKWEIFLSNLSLVFVSNKVRRAAWQDQIVQSDQDKVDNFFEPIDIRLKKFYSLMVKSYFDGRCLNKLNDSLIKTENNISTILNIRDTIQSLLELPNFENYNSSDNVAKLASTDLQMRLLSLKLLKTIPHYITDEWFASWRETLPIKKPSYWWWYLSPSDGNHWTIGSIFLLMSSAYIFFTLIPNFWSDGFDVFGFLGISLSGTMTLILSGAAINKVREMLSSIVNSSILREKLGRKYHLTSKGVCVFSLFVFSFASSIFLLSPPISFLYNFVGIQNYKQGDYYSAADAHIRAIRFDPKNWEATYNLAKDYELSEQKPLAIKYYNQVWNATKGKAENNFLARQSAVGLSRIYMQDAVLARSNDDKLKDLSNNDVANKLQNASFTLSEEWLFNSLTCAYQQQSFRFQLSRTLICTQQAEVNSPSIRPQNILRQDPRLRTLYYEQIDQIAKLTTYEFSQIGQRTGQETTNLTKNLIAWLTTGSHLADEIFILHDNIDDERRLSFQSSLFFVDEFLLRKERLREKWGKSDELEFLKRAIHSYISRSKFEEINEFNWLFKSIDCLVFKQAEAASSQYIKVVFQTRTSDPRPELKPFIIGISDIQPLQLLGSAKSKTLEEIQPNYLEKYIQLIVEEIYGKFVSKYLDVSITPINRKDYVFEISKSCEQRELPIELAEPIVQETKSVSNVK
jgi:hypothetical protein